MADAPFPKLGYLRQRALSCVAVQDPFQPAPGQDVRAAFRDYARRMADTWGHLEDPLSIGLIATMALLSGDIAAAGRILDTLPATPVETDHGAGYCAVLPFQALAAVLPVDEDLGDPGAWTKGAPAERRLRSWLSEHQAKLIWDDTEAVYRL